MTASVSDCARSQVLLLPLLLPHAVSTWVWCMHDSSLLLRAAIDLPTFPVFCSTLLQVIKKPMDLSLIRERIMSGALLSLDDMNRDLFVMCNNAMVFNGKGDPYFDYSKVCRSFICTSWK